MIVTCPSCSTRYLVDPAALGDSGRTVRCARCGTTWFERPPDDAPQRIDVIPPPTETEPLPPGSNLPALPRQRRVGGWVGWLALVVVVAGVAAAAILGRERIVAAWPPAERLYAMVGLAAEAPAPAFALRNVKQAVSVEDDAVVVVVSGAIVNVSSVRGPVPKIQAQLYDKAHKLLRTWSIAPPRPELGPGETVVFTDRFTNPPKGATSLTVQIVADG